jgi:sister-chromatid-cohesion protein PDS5
MLRVRRSGCLQVGIIHTPLPSSLSLRDLHVMLTIGFRFSALRTEHLEIIFIRLLHLLAHHPDFSTAHDDLLDIVK